MSEQIEIAVFYSESHYVVLVCYKSPNNTAVHIFCVDVRLLCTGNRKTDIKFLTDRAMKREASCVKVCKHWIGVLKSYFLFCPMNDTRLKGCH